jgi:hypothetical protein
MGLSATRSGGGAFGDDMDGASIWHESYHDCNGNGRDDAVDIAVGSSNDDNGNGIPDECDPQGASYCFCNTGPCANNDSTAGCANSTGGGARMDGIGSDSITIDDFALIATGLPINKFAIFYMGGGQAQLTFGDGQRCVSTGGVGIFRYLPPKNTGPTGSLQLGPQVADLACSSFSGAGCITASSTWNFQTWYRDPMGPCGNAFNLTNGVSVTFAP